MDLLSSFYPDQGEVLSLELSEDRRRRDLLGLLAVCLRPHREAAMLPFALNTFSYGTFKGMKNTSRLLTNEQRAAIRSVQVSIFWIGSNYSRSNHFADLYQRPLEGVTSLTALFPGVANVQINVQLYVRDAFRNANCRPEVAKDMLHEWLAGGGRYDIRVTYEEMA
ncbi:hypothetical protein EK21DRAFT_84398 [Setomelanomma holmii]|uniref:Uncharacterized protein n=1 Tax=Setomelanomma holmii TaxID=210430 RepID=A0A9P4HM16_9PLEO|nr:hypothetical protein EK21DRAFT_84398 [Setomelanomma holmii]